MDEHLRPEPEPEPEPKIRLSNSPRRSPIVQQALSPVRSVHPERLESMNTQSDLATRGLNFFESDTSEDESTALAMPGDGAPEEELLRKHRWSGKKRFSNGLAQPLASRCEPKRVSVPPEEGYQPLAAEPHRGVPSRFTSTPTTSYNGSVDELLLGDHSSPTRFPRQAHSRSPRVSAQVEPREGEQRERKPSQVNHLLGAHAIAHEITLQALMRDEQVLDSNLHSFAPLRTDYRTSLMPEGLRTQNDPRSPRNPTFATPSSAASKKVHLVPPPIDTMAPRRSLPPDLVRTPYPCSAEKVHPKDFNVHSPPPSATRSIAAASESVLTLSIRRTNAHTVERLTSLTIPATALSGPISVQGIEKQKALPFDDAELFRRLRKAYLQLSGPARYFSARSLRRIAISGTASRAADAGYGWLNLPRSPRTLAYHGLSDTFSEEKILQHYRNPELGRARFAFVHWAHRLAAPPPVRTPQGETDVDATIERDMTRRMEQPGGLEFVVGWSIVRISLALMVVLGLSIAAALLWIFLGRSSLAGNSSHGGFRDAGDRVGPGILVGVCVLLLGLSGTAGWLGVSWLVM